MGDMKRFFLILVEYFVFRNLFILHSQPLIGFNSSYKYCKGSNAGFLPSKWHNASFDDSGWASSVVPFRYGDGSGGTHLSDM